MVSLLLADFREVREFFCISASSIFVLNLLLSISDSGLFITFTDLQCVLHIVHAIHIPFLCSSAKLLEYLFILLYTNTCSVLPPDVCVLKFTFVLFTLRGNNPRPFVMS